MDVKSLRELYQEFDNYLWKNDIDPDDDLNDLVSRLGKLLPSKTLLENIEEYITNRPTRNVFHPAIIADELLPKEHTGTVRVEAVLKSCSYELGLEMIGDNLWKRK